MEIYVDKKSENLLSKIIFIEANQLLEKCCEIGHFIIAIMSPICLVIPRAIYCYAIYFITDLGNDAFGLPLPVWYPFDWKNPLGYLFAVALQYIATYYFFVFISCTLFYALGVFLLEVSAIKDIENDLKLINENAVAKDNRLLTLNRFGDFIQNHSTLKRVVDEFLDVYQIPLVVLFVWGLITICGALLLIQMQIQERNSVVLLAISIFAFYAFGMVLVPSELGQRLTDSYEEIDNGIESFDWYLYPYELQRMLPTILMMAQKPVEMEFFGSISALRESFKKIIKAAFSYFMTMRRFIK